MCEPITTLGAVIDLMKNGTTATQTSQKTPFPVTRIETISDGNINLNRVGFLSRDHADYRLQKNDILLSHINSLKHIGKVAIIEGEYPLYHGMNLMLIRINENRSYPKYVYHSLNLEQSREFFRRECKPAVNQCSLGQNEIKSLSFFLPKKIQTQRTIAAILDTVDEAIRRTEALIAKLRKVKAGMLHDLLTRGLDENGELRDPILHPEQFKASPLGRIPGEWEIKGLLDIAPIVEGQVDPKSAPYINLFLVAPDHIESGSGRLLSLATAGEQGAISGKYLFQSGDVVYCKIRPYLRKVWLASFVGLCSADMYPFRPGKEINSQFLLMTLLSERFSNYAISVSERSGFPKINRTEISCFQVALPPQAEQNRIAKAIKSIEERITIEETKKNKFFNIKQGLMQDLLTGHVRVPESMLCKYQDGCGDGRMRDEG